MLGFGEGTVDVNASGWPTGTVDGTASCSAVWTGVLQGSAPSVAGAVGNNVDYVASVSGTVCTYAYQLDGGSTRSIQYDSSNGVVTIDAN
ncbi:hypothetical protein D3C81_2031200 [compost metagenome]